MCKGKRLWKNGYLHHYEGTIMTVKNGEKNMVDQHRLTGEKTVNM
jgi:hypothetical protein